jgi:hypothetical protein
MLFRFLRLVLALLTLWQAALGQDMKARERAAEQVLRLPPSAFPELPHTVAQDLQKRGCSMPQTNLPPKPHNVLRGEFARAGQTDWVVLCTQNKPSSSLGPNLLPLVIPIGPPAWTSTILIFFGGFTANVSEIAQGLDAYDMIPIERFSNGMTVITGYEYARGIRGVGESFIMEHIRAYGEPGVKYPPIDHQGVEDPILDKASIIHYFYQGKWLELLGAD